jgi:hypothetical protein
MRRNNIIRFIIEKHYDFFQRGGKQRNGEYRGNQGERNDLQDFGIN